MTHSIPQKLLAEALGTGLLVATVVGSGIMAERLAEGNIAVALLANTIATGAILYVLITALGPVSGAHFNPVVSAIFGLRGELPWSLSVAFMAVQIIGGILGTLAAHAMFEETVIQISVKSRSGSAQVFSEAVATFALVFTILMTLRARPSAVPPAVALVITAGYWFTASTSFANPAVTIARVFSDTFAGISPADAIPFIGIQFVGGVTAWWITDHLLAARATDQDEVT